MRLTGVVGISLFARIRDFERQAGRGFVCMYVSRQHIVPTDCHVRWVNNI